MRPPILDELGLINALHSYCASFPLEVTIDATTLPSLPAAVEVAAYRIVTEALTNVSRHANAQRAHVSISVDSAVKLSVADDGSASEPWTPGVGLMSIRERAAELGGTCTVGPTDRGGRVVATLPLGAEA